MTMDLSERGLTTGKGFLSIDCEKGVPPPTRKAVFLINVLGTANLSTQVGV